MKPHSCAVHTDMYRLLWLLCVWLANSISFRGQNCEVPHQLRTVRLDKHESSNQINGSNAGNKDFTVLQFQHNKNITGSTCEVLKGNIAFFCGHYR